MTNDMESLLDAFLYETNGLLDRLDQILVQDEELATLSSEDINEIFRIMHTTKSSSAMMGYKSLSVVAHKIEDLFSYIRDKQDGLDFLSGEVKKSLFNLLFQAEDYIRTQMLHIENGTDPDEDTEDLQKQIAQMLAEIKGEPATEEIIITKTETPVRKQEAVLPAQTETLTATPVASKKQTETTAVLPDDADAQIFIHVSLLPNLMMENLRAFTIVTAMKESGLLFRYYPTDMDSNMDTARTIAEQGFFLAFDSLDAATIAETMLDAQHNVSSYECIDAPKNDYMQVVRAAQEEAEILQNQQTAETHTEAAEENHTETVKKTVNHGPVKQNLMSVNLSKLDELNNLVGEIVITESMVTSSPVLNQLSPEALDIFNKSARQLRKLTDDLQDIAMALRMVPLSGVFQKMNRVVRDMKTKLNKDVRLTIIGENTEVDKTIVDAIQDPMIHLVRNCMDHGIENTVEERIEAGKPEEGEIILSASHTSSEVIISVTDDGYGMDTEKILNKAEKMGLLTKPRSRYSHKEALNLILLPGFSTNTEVTEYSGRGVGMDVVKRNIEAVGGTIGISSELGVGTTMTFKIPLTLAIVDGMKAAVGDTIFTISISNIRQTFKMKQDEVVLDEYGNEMVCKQGEFYPIIHLSDFFHLNGKAKSVEEGIIIWVEAGESSCCLLADELIGQQQVVVKPLPQYLVNFNLKNYGISGCTILGDGTISIILDVLGVYHAAIEEERKETEHA